MSTRRELHRGLRIGRFAGVELVADWSLLIIFALIALSLGAGAFPTWHPEWSPGLSWLMALIAATLFFASIAIHELSHAVVARRHGVKVRRITLFLFGGLAQMEGQPPSPRAELAIAAAGPIASVLIGVLATAAGVLLAPSAVTTDDPELTIQLLGPTSTMLLWLGPINILLAMFNLIPGFPLDGGRLLRAALWWGTGDLRRATRWAARAGQAVAWTLMGAGVAMALGLYVPILGGGFGQGIWLLLIGWFLNNAARMSYQQLVVRQALDDVHVGEVMRTKIDRIAPETSLRALVEEHALDSDLGAFPVVSGDDLIGLVELAAVRKVPRERWDALSVADVMEPASSLATMSPDDDALDALQELSRHDPIPIVEGRKFVGFVRAQDVMRWLSWRDEAVPA